MEIVLPLAVASFLGLCLATTGLLRPMSLGRSGIFLFATSLLTALFYGAFRLTDGPLVLGALAKMMGEANYAFLILFLRWQRKPLPRHSEQRGALAVVVVSLLHLTLNLTLTGAWQMGVMTLQVLVLIGWVTLEAWWLWRAQPDSVRLLLVVLVAGHWLAELAGRSSLIWTAWQGGLGLHEPGWTDVTLDWMWVTFFLGFMAQIAIGGVVAQALRRDKERLQLLVGQVETMLQEKESLVMALLASNAAREADPHLASLTHELRQPLGSIQMNAEYLASSRRLSLEEESEVLQEILRENHRAVSIVQGLRSLFAEQSPQHAVVDLTDWLSRWVERQAPLLAQQFDVDLRWLAQTHVCVRANAAQLDMLLQNLVNNAVEAMAEQGGGTIELVLGCDARLAWLDVHDNGPGVPQGLSDRVFELSFSTKKQGMGLGLWLSRRIALLHGGHLGLVERKQGACMRLTLPLEQG